ncbi:MAG: C4-dicarboxylate TRAP transporter substrate-binding protein [Planctomycetota bacterium]|jgi:tripartite ATP-independent transporter DctP family solute receptor|nr:C4-dicarboxylate TRAP transporter substrate-binding protein [Planctomycetota bacterium]
MERKSASLWLLAAVALALAVPPSRAADPLTVSIATVIPPGTPVPMGLERLSEALNRTGDFKTAVYPAGQLGSLTDVMDRCLDGDPTIMTCDPADLADITVKDLSIAQAPFLFSTWNEVDKLTNSAWWGELVGRVEKKGMRILAYNWAFGERHILTRKPIRKVADLAGLKIRIPNNVNFVKTFQALGAAPTPMALAEVFTSLQQGTIDGLENPYSDIYANHFHEAGKYLVDDDHIKQICLIICGSAFFDTLSEKQQKELIDASVEAGKFQRDLVLRLANEFKGKLADAGATFTNIDRAEFIQATEKYYSYPEFSAWTPGLRDTVLAIIGGK